MKGYEIKNITLYSFMMVGLLFFQTQLRAETIHYSITQLGMKVGEATLNNAGASVYRGQNTFLIVFKAQALNFWDEEKIYTDPENFYPLFVERNLNIFGRKEMILEEYDRPKGEVRITKTAGDKVTQQIIKKNGAVDNIYGFIFRYRQKGSFKVGDELDVNLPTKDLKIKLVKRFDLWNQGKQYDSFYMQSDPAKYKIWFDHDPQKLPLRISGAVGVANTSMEMTSREE